MKRSSSNLNTIPSAFKTIFADVNYLILGLFLSLFFIFVYISIPVYTVPGNSYGFFLSATPLLELISLFFLGAIVGVVFTMQIYAWKHSYKAKSNTAMGLTGFLSGSLSGIFSTATCVNCVAALFSFVGFGGTLFLIEHRWEIVGLSTLIVLMSLFFTSKKIVNGCKACKI